MANLTREERLRREAEAANAATEEPVAPPPGSPEPAVETPPEPVPPPPPVPEKKPKAAVSRPAPPVEEPEKPRNPYDDVSPDALSAFVEKEHSTEVQRSKDAVEQAVRDARDAAERKVREARETKALLAEPGNLRLRKAFLAAFSPTANIPPKPAPTPFGMKDEALMNWYATYHPEKYLEIYGQGKSPLATKLTEEVKSRLNSN